MLDTGRLRRAWWSTPLAMTGWLFALLAIPSVQQDPRGIVGALVAAGVLGGMGILWGLRSSARAKRVVSKQFNVDYLPPEDQLSRRVAYFAERLDLPPPEVGVMETANAFAVGSNPNQSAVVLGLPLIKLLSDDELDAVIGHELGHIATRDVHRMQVAVGYQSMFVFMFTAAVTIWIRVLARSRAQARLGALFGALGRYSLFLGSELIVRRLSRKREFHADAIGAALTSPESMSNALLKLHGAKLGGSDAEGDYAYLMFRNARGGSVFATHPPVEARVAALREGTYLRALRANSPKAPTQKIQLPSLPDLAQLRQKAGTLRSNALKSFTEVSRPQSAATRPRRRRARRPSAIFYVLLYGAGILFGYYVTMRLMGN